MWGICLCQVYVSYDWRHDVHGQVSKANYLAVIDRGRVAAEFSAPTRPVNVGIYQDMLIAVQRYISTCPRPDQMRMTRRRTHHMGSGKGVARVGIVHW